MLLLNNSISRRQYESFAKPEHFLLRIERIDFSEVTGGLRPGGPMPRRELKKNRPSLGKYELCKALSKNTTPINQVFQNKTSGIRLWKGGFRWLLLLSGNKRERIKIVTLFTAKTLARVEENTQPDSQRGSSASLTRV
ncbi:MAG: hypothetical protein ACQEQO_00470 [Thermodesulfobacteriota bacterium]